MKVLICDPIDKQAIEKMQKAGLIIDSKSGITPEELLKIVENYEVLVVRSATKVTKEVITRGKNLKLIVRGGVGLDNINTEAASQANIKVENTPEASSVSVAELAIGMMFTFARKIAIADVLTKQGKWEKKRLEGFELWQKTLGLIGLGRIGYEVAKRALGLEMKVIAYDPYVNPADPKIIKLGIKMVSLDELLASSDFISLHIPLTEETKNLINAQTLARMKKNAVIINCARGGIVNEKDLAEAIKNGTIAGACLDVYEQEPITPDNPLLQLGEKVVLTPHLGASTEEGQARVGEAVANKLIAFYSSK